MLRLLAMLCNESVLFSLEVERIGGVTTLHVLIPKPVTSLSKPLLNL